LRHGRGHHLHPRLRARHAGAGLERARRGSVVVQLERLYVAQVVIKAPAVRVLANAALDQRHRLLRFAGGNPTINIYGDSWMDFDEYSGLVIGTCETDMDDYGGPYYVPYVQCMIYDEDGNMVAVRS